MKVAVVRRICNIKLACGELIIKEKASKVRNPVVSLLVCRNNGQLAEPLQLATASQLWSTFQPQFVSRALPATWWKLSIHHLCPSHQQRY